MELTHEQRAVLITGVAGLAVGGLAGFLVARQVYRRRLEEELEAARFHYDAKVISRVDRLVPDPDGDGNEWPEAALGNDEGRAEEGADTPLFVKYERLPVPADREDVADGEASTGYGEPVLTELDEPWPPVDRNTTLPYRISVAELGELGPGSQEISIKWFPDGDVLVDDKEQLIDNRLKVTGPLSLDMFGGPSGDPNVCYIRNHYLDADFEVVLDRHNYATYVLGFSEDEIGVEVTEDGTAGGSRDSDGNAE